MFLLFAIYKWIILNKQNSYKSDIKFNIIKNDLFQLVVNIYNLYKVDS